MTFCMKKNCSGKMSRRALLNSVYIAFDLLDCQVFVHQLCKVLRGHLMITSDVLCWGSFHVERLNVIRARFELAFGFSSFNSDG